MTSNIESALTEKRGVLVMTESLPHPLASRCGSIRFFQGIVNMRIAQPPDSDPYQGADGGGEDDERFHWLPSLPPSIGGAVGQMVA